MTPSCRGLLLASCLSIGCAEPRFAESAGAPTERAASRRDQDPRLQDAAIETARARAIAVELYALGEAASDGAPIAASRVQALELEQRRSTDRATADYARIADDPALAMSAVRATALFRVGRALKERGDESAAQSRYRALVKDFPRAAEAAPAHLALAEIAFETEALREAIDECDSAIAATVPGDAIRVSALYLKAWSLRGEGETADPRAIRRAMEALRDLVALAPQARGGARDIAVSAEQELIELYAVHGDPATAEAFFDALGNPVAARILTSLRERYRRGPPTQSL